VHGTVPDPVARRVAATVADLAESTETWGKRVAVDPVELLESRARMAGFTAHDNVSANGTCRLLAAGDDWVAVNLARPDDLETVRALVGSRDDVWTALAAALQSRGAELVATLHDLEIPTATLGSAADLAPVEVRTLGAARPAIDRPVVVDLSAMWAGPVCAWILGLAGAHVIKVEDPARPDGSRSGPPGFFEALHEGHEMRSVRLRERGALADLLERADLVIESSRPRALRQLGIVAEDFVAARPGRIWLSVSGYGRWGAHANRVAFGDDAAVAGGLTAWSGGRPVFCGDAIADPLTGLYAGLAVSRSISAGGGQLIALAMAGVCADVNRRASC
jgi:CoA-transferase family III